MNIHGETEHVGKKPAKYAQGTEKRTQLIRLRRDMKEAINAEDYERASQLRDEIRADRGSAEEEEITRRAFGGGMNCSGPQRTSSHQR